MMFWYGDGIHNGTGWAFLLMVIGMVAFWGLVIGGVALLLRRPDRRDTAAGGMVLAHRTAQQLLAERFARGEIEEAEFTGRLAALHGSKQL